MKTNVTNLQETFIFLEGEAFQFYYIFGDTISFIQMKENFPVGVWQANINGNPLEQFAGGYFTNERGTAPSIDTSYLYYSRGTFGVSSTWESGLIDRNGEITQLGYKRAIEGIVTDEIGEILLILP